MSRIITVVSIALLAVALRYAPGEPMTALFDADPAKDINARSATQSFSANQQGVVRFLGGDGVTMLTGQIHRRNDDDDKDSVALAPVIVMAHGLGYSTDCGLTPFIEAFQQAGFAVFTFDFSSLGASDGIPRHQVRPGRQVDDLRSAVTTVKQHGPQLGFDASRLVLWGTSLAGGHVLHMASTLSKTKDISIRAVVSLVPALASPAESALGTIAASPGPALQGLAKVILAVIRCGMEILWTGNPWYIPLVGPPGSHAAMQNPGDQEGYLALKPANGGLYGWRNALTADSILHLLPYRPLNQKLDQIHFPCLLVAAQNDTLCPVRYAELAAQKVPKAELVVIPGKGHFDLYQGDGLQQVLSKMITFVKEQILDV